MGQDKSYAMYMGLLKCFFIFELVDQYVVIFT